MANSTKNNNGSNQDNGLASENATDTFIDDSVIEATNELNSHLSSELDNLGKVREILFGENVENINAQINALESSINNRLEEQALEVRAKLEELESSIKEELDKVSSALSSEKGERLDGEEDIRSSLTSVKSLLTDEVSSLALQFNSRAEEESRDLRKKIEDEGKELRKKLENSSSDITDSIEGLKNDKASRASLAGMFEQFAKVLAEEDSKESKAQKSKKN